MKFVKCVYQAVAVVVALIPAVSFGYVIDVSSATRSPAVGNPNIYTSVPLVTISSGGPSTDTFQMNWDLSGYTSTPLLASALFTVRSFTSQQIVLDVHLSNLTSTTFQSSILALGLGVSPDVTGLISPVGSPDIYFDGVSPGSGPNQTFPGGFKQIDVCAYAANNCAGGNINDGIASGNDDSFRLTMRTGAGSSFGSPTSIVQLSDFALKFQTQAGSFELPACVNGGCGTRRVPEPSTLMLGIAALFAMTAARRRNNK